RMNQSDFECRLIEPDKAHKRAGDQEMDVRPLVVHVFHAVLGLIVLYARPGQLAAAPLRLASGNPRRRPRPPNPPPVEFSAETVVVAAVAAGPTIVCQFGEPRAKP